MRLIGFSPGAWQPGIVRVLLVEDEAKLAGILARGLRAGGLSADIAADGQEALCLAGATRYEVIVLDVMLPDLSGIQVCRSLREQGNQAPVLMLTALDAVADRIAGLDSGADDYLAKPFDFEELLARLRALARRPGGPRSPVLKVGDLTLDPASGSVRRGELAIGLTPKELALLTCLMRRPGEVLSRYDLLESAWDQAYENRSNVVDVYMRYLREKVDRPFGVHSIQTVRGLGYRIGTGIDAGDRAGESSAVTGSGVGGSGVG